MRRLTRLATGARVAAWVLVLGTWIAAGALALSDLGSGNGGSANAQEAVDCSGAPETHAELAEHSDLQVSVDGTHVSGLRCNYVIEDEDGNISSTAISIDYGCTDRIDDRFAGLSRKREADEGEPDPEISRGSNHLYLRTFAGGFSTFLNREFAVFDRLFIKFNDRTIATITGHSDRDEGGNVIHDLFEEEGLANTLAFRYADRASNDPACSGAVPTSGGSTGVAVAAAETTPMRVRLRVARPRARASCS